MKKLTHAFSIQFFVLFFALLVPHVSAETFVVTRTDDPIPDGCAVGDCSLREAIIAANDDNSENHTIQVTGGMTYTLSIAGDVYSGFLEIEGVVLEELRIFSTNDEEGSLKILNADRTIRIESTGGGMAEIDADGTGPVFMILDETVAELDGLKITGGDNSSVGGGIIVAYNESLTITNSLITGNTALSAAGMDVLGGTIVLEDSEISQNESISEGVPLAGAMSIDEAPLYQDITTLAELEDIEWVESNVTIRRSEISNNTAEVGGAFDISRSTLNVIESTVSGNRAYARGGGFYISRGAIVNIDRSTISGNIARDEEGDSGRGAGIMVIGIQDSDEGAEVLIINSTISGNDAGGPGAGILVDRFGAKTVNIINTTITGNTGSFTTAGGVQAYGGTLNIANSIIANQAEGDDCQISDQGSSIGEPLVYTSLGHNLESETSCEFTATGDIQDSDPLLDDLQDNGGPVFTHAFTSPLSPAVNNGSNTLYTNAGGNLGSDSDANGNDRVYNFGSGGIIDIGAFELQQDATFDGCPVTNEDKILFVKKGESGTGANWSDALGELRDALALFEDETCTTDDVEEIWVTAGTYLPTDDSGDREATFLMPGVNILGGFEGDETNENQRDLESNVSILSGEINSDNDLSGNSYHVITSMDESFGALFNFTITGGNANGTAPHDKGGGLYASNGGISMADVLFENNYAETAGGGAYVIETEDRIGAQHPKFTRTIFRNNESGEDGGGLALEDAESRITSVMFENNNAGQFGGGLFNDGADPVLKNVIFKENSSDLEGGAILNNLSSPELFNVLITNNDAFVNGGGLVNGTNSSPVLTNVTISGNDAENGNGGGMYNRNGAAPMLLNTIVWGNTASGTGNEIWNSSNSSIEIDYSLYNSGTDDIVEGDDFTALNSWSTDPLFEDTSDPDGSDNIFGTSDDGFALQSSSPAINTGDPDTDMSDFIFLGVGFDEVDLAKNPRVFDGDVDIIDIGAYEFQGNTAPPGSCPATDNILYVKKGESGIGASWNDALGELRDIYDLFDSEDCTTDDVDEIWVAEGVYIPGTDPLDTFQLINNIEIYGGFAGTENSLSERDWQANPTILSGDIDDDDDPFDPDADSDSDTDTPSQTDHLIGVNSYQVVTGNGTDNSAVLDGFTITGGKGNGSAPQDTGGGIYNVSGSPALTNLTLIGNRALLYGGGMYNESSSPTLTNVTLSGNSAGGDTGFGGGIYNEESSSPTLVNVILSGNSATHSGGGMLNWDSNPTLTNVTISGNSAGVDGGGMANDNSSPTLTNTIIWENTASGNGNEINNNGSSSIDLDYSLYRDRDGESDIVEGGGFTALNSLTTDPFFEDTSDPDGSDNTFGTSDDGFALQSASPAINTGDPSTNLALFPGGSSDPTDLAGNSRVYDGDVDIIDIGAYEFQGEPTEEPEFAPFITTWEVEAGDLEITIPTVVGPISYNYDVDWGDGETDTGQTGDASHTYDSAGTYTVKITGTFPQIEFFNSGEEDKILSVEQWGDIEWASMRKAFQGATKLVINASDKPDLSNATSMLEMFSGATSVNGGLENWDVSTITSMFGVFDGATSFNGDISGWTVSAATDMIRMFAGATAFNQNLGGWNISSVTTMESMLSNSGLSTENYDATLTGWAAQTVKSEVDLGADGLTYCEAEADRQSLIDDDSWEITGDALAEACGDEPVVLDAPTLTSPSDESTDIGLPVTLNWNTVDEATSYQVQLVEESGSFDTPDFDDETTNTDTEVTGLSESTEYKWRVRALSNEDESSWSEVWTFTTAAAEVVLDAPTLSSPDDESNDVNRPVTLVWNAVDDATSYDVQVVMESGSFDSPFFDEESADTDIEVPGLDPSTEYKWRVRAVNNETQSEWSEIWTFTTGADEEELVAPQLSSPADEAIDIPFTVNLDWDAAGGAESYQSQLVEESGSFDTPDFDDETAETDIEVTGLDPLTEYKWRVRSLAGEDESDWSSVWTFTTRGLPDGEDQRILVSNASDYEFSKSDFGISNDDFSVKIGTLPDEGTLLFEDEPVNPGDEISIEKVNAGKLAWDMPDGEYAYNFTSFEFRIVDDSENQSEEVFTLTIDLGTVLAELSGSEGWRFMANPSDGDSYNDLFSGITVETGPPPAQTLYELDQENYEWTPVESAGDEPGVATPFIVYVFEGDLPVTVESGDNWNDLDGTFSYSGLNYDNDGSTPNSGNFYLLGNPHPIALDFCQFDDDNISTSAYFWNSEANGGNGDYVSLNCAAPEDVLIAPFQSFWVRTTDTNPVLDIPVEAYLESTTEGYFKDVERSAKSSKEFAGLGEGNDQPSDRSKRSDGYVVSLNVSGEEGLFTNRTQILFTDDAKAGLDRFDAPKLSAEGLASQWLSFHSMDEDGRRYAFQSLPASLLAGDKVRIPLDIQTTEYGRFTLDWNLPDAHIFSGSYYLRDNQTGEVIELREGSSYSFEIEPDQTSKVLETLEVSGAAISQPSDRSKRSDGLEPRFELLIAASGVDGLTELGAVPEDFTLAQNYPNPFNPTTVINYQLPVSSEVRLEVYDMLGRNVATLVDGQVSAGRHTVNFDASRLSSGVYLYRLQAGSQIMTKKLTILK